MLLIVGLDGASLDLTRPWAEAGELPHLQRLLAHGAWGPLRSTMPPATFPAWTTFMTGVNPGRHGIFDFTRRVAGEYRVQFINGSFRKVPTVWSRLSAAGRRVAVFGMPGTYPPEPINGQMVSGFDTPVTTRADASFVHPPQLAEEVAANGGFPFADFQEFKVDREWYREALRRLLEGIAIKTRFVARQLRRERWDCATVVFGESDTAAHHFWRFCDPQSPRHDADGAGEFGGAIRAVYAALDRAIGELIDAAEPSTVLVCSDHGFGGVGRTVVHLNGQLAQAGLLHWRSRSVASQAATLGKRWLLRWLPPTVQARCFRLGGGRFADALESAARFADIDWKQTRAFSEELNYAPSIWINVSGRDALGVVATNEYGHACDEVTAALGELRDPDSGEPIVARVWHRDELYHGPWVQLAPDLTVEFALPGGYSYACLPTRLNAGDEPVRVASTAEMTGGKLTGMSGSHRRDGLFVLSGAVPPAGFLAADICDMAPTILALCEVPIPSDFDGRSLVGVGALESAASCTPSDAIESEHAYTADEERMIEGRLQALGYLA